MTVMSYMGTVHFGLVACSDALPRVTDLADGVVVAASELLAAAADLAPLTQPTEGLHAEQGAEQTPSAEHQRRRSVLP